MSQTFDQMRQMFVVTEDEGGYGMASKTDVQVLLGGKVYTLSGYESEEYLQKYINLGMMRVNRANLTSLLLMLQFCIPYSKSMRILRLSPRHING